MWQPGEPAIEEHLYFFAPLAETLDKVNTSPICVELSLLENCLSLLILPMNQRVALWSQKFVTLLLFKSSPVKPLLSYPNITF